MLKAGAGEAEEKLIEQAQKLVSDQGKQVESDAALFKAQ